MLYVTLPVLSEQKQQKREEGSRAYVRVCMRALRPVCDRYLLVMRLFSRERARIITRGSAHRLTNLVYTHTRERARTWTQFAVTTCSAMHTHIKRIYIREPTVHADNYTRMALPRPRACTYIYVHIRTYVCTYLQPLKRRECVYNGARRNSDRFSRKYRR